MSESFENLVDRVVGIARAIRATNPDRHHLMTSYWIWPHEYPEPAAELAAVTEAIRGLNPKMLETSGIQRPIVMAILEQVVADDFDEPALRKTARERISWLVDYEGYLEIHVQLVNLILRSPFGFGGVEIRPIPNSGDLTEYNLKYEGPLGSKDLVSFVNSYGAVAKAPGLSDKAWRNAIDMIEEVLIIVRAIGLPHLWGRKWLEAGVAGRGAASGFVIMRQRIGPWDMSVAPGLPSQYMVLESMLRNWTDGEIALAQSVCTAGQPTKLQTKIRQALAWLGEATLPGSNSSKYARLSIAFETAVGGRAASVSEIGVTQMLAERTAFLLGKDDADRLRLHKVVTDLYGTRSDILHGDPDPVDDTLLARWAMLVWKAVRAVLNRSSEFETVEDLANWVRKQRYSLPAQPT